MKRNITDRAIDQLANLFAANEDCARQYQDNPEMLGVLSTINDSYAMAFAILTGMDLDASDNMLRQRGEYTLENGGWNV